MQVLVGSRGFWCRYLVRFRKFPVQLPDEVPEDLGDLAEKMLGEVPEGSGADTL